MPFETGFVVVCDVDVSDLLGVTFPFQYSRESLMVSARFSSVYLPFLTAENDKRQMWNRFQAHACLVSVGNTTRKASALGICLSGSDALCSTKNSGTLQQEIYTQLVDCRTQIWLGPQYVLSTLHLILQISTRRVLYLWRVTVLLIKMVHVFFFFFFFFTLRYWRTPRSKWMSHRLKLPVVQ